MVKQELAISNISPDRRVSKNARLGTILSVSYTNSERSFDEITTAINESLKNKGELPLVSRESEDLEQWYDVRKMPVNDDGLWGKLRKLILRD